MRTEKCCRLTGILTILLLICLAAPPAAFAGQNKITIKLATLAPEGTVFYDTLLKISSEWFRLSEGKVKVKIFPGGIAGSEQDVVRKLRIGQLQAATISSLGMMSIDPAYAALQLPGLITTYGELDYCRERMTPVFEKRFTEKGFVILNYGELGHMYFFTSQQVTSVADLKQKKLCTFASDQSSRKLWSEAGFKVIDVSMNEMQTALQTGLVDGFLNSPVFALSYQLFAKAKHMLNVSYGIAVASTIIRRDVWNRINPELQQTLLRAAHDAARDIQPKVRALDQKAIDEMQKHGLQVTEIDPQNFASWWQPIWDVYPRIRGEVIPPDIFDQTLNLRNQFRAGHQAGAPPRASLTPGLMD